MLKKGDIDILPDVGYTPARDSLYIMSINVLSSWIQVYTTKRTIINVISDLNDKKIGVLRGSVQETYMKKIFNKRFRLNYKVISFKNYSASVQALKQKKIDLIVASRFFYFSKECDNSIIPTGIIPKLSNLHLAFRKNINPGLVKTFNKEISAMQNNPKSIYYKSLNYWFNKDTGYRIPKYIIGISILAILIFIILATFSLMLRHKVRQKTHLLEIQNQELKAAKEKAEESDRLKTVFLQNMSHEIRTPMNGILGFINIMKKTDLSQENKAKYIDIIKKSSDRLLNTINNIIEISKIEAGQIIVQSSDVNVKEIMEDLHDFYFIQARQKGILFALNNQVTEHIKTDKLLLSNILSNVLNNALKFTSKGSIEFGNFIENESVVFYIKDTGIGIEDDKLDTVFNRFIQGDMRKTRSYEGSGLGLAISKAYVEKLHGNIRIESDPGQGSTFFISIPYKPVLNPDS